jgi:Na+-transporting NADH:ubiquinone oxidoreductase subunit NqrC
MTASLLEVERKEISSRYRSGVIKKLTDIIQANYYKDEADALNYARGFKDRQEVTSREISGHDIDDPMEGDDIDED